MESLINHPNETPYIIPKIIFSTPFTYKPYPINNKEPKNIPPNIAIINI